MFSSELSGYEPKTIGLARDRPSRSQIGIARLKGGQITLKDDLDAKIPKGPKIKEKSPKSDKSEPSEKAQEQNKTKKYFPSFGNSIKSM